MNDVSRWLTAGAEVREGLRLLSIYAPSKYLTLLLQKAPGKYRKHLEDRLLPFADEPPAVPAAVPSSVQESGSFRKQWPFLSDASCPMEMKVLAADKITAYHEFTRLHERLFDCVTPDMCFETSRNLLENYRQNRQILAEFTYFKEHGRVLGKHPVFKRTKKAEQYRKMGAVTLLKKKQNLEGAIWRIKSEMAKHDKPHLEEERRTRLAQKEWELGVVCDLVRDFEKE